MAKNSKRRAWTPVQVRSLKTLVKRKTHAASIAKKLKQTVSATRQKAFSMGLSLDSRARLSRQQAYGDISTQAPAKRGAFFCNLLLYWFRVNRLEFYATLYQKLESAGAVCGRL